MKIACVAGGIRRRVLHVCVGGEAVNANGEAARGLARSGVEFPRATKKHGGSPPGLFHGKNAQFNTVASIGKHVTSGR